MFPVEGHEGHGFHITFPCQIMLCLDINLEPYNASPKHDNQFIMQIDKIIGNLYGYIGCLW